MKINNIDVLVSKIDTRKSKNGEPYIVIGFLDLGSGDNFEIIDKDITILQKVRQMTKYKLNLKLTNSKYGLMLKIDDVVKELGSI